VARRDEKAQAMHVPSSMLAIVSEPGHPAPLLWVGRNYVDAGSAARGGFSSLVLYRSTSLDSGTFSYRQKPSWRSFPSADL